MSSDAHARHLAWREEKVWQRMGVERRRKSELLQRPQLGQLPLFQLRVKGQSSGVRAFLGVTEAAAPSGKPLTVDMIREAMAKLMTLSDRYKAERLNNELRVMYKLADHPDWTVASIKAGVVVDDPAQPLTDLARERMLDWWRAYVNDGTIPFGMEATPMLSLGRWLRAHE